MPTLNQVRNVIDIYLNNLWDNITGKQYQYFQTHGRYWQGLKTHTYYPVFDAAVDAPITPDNLDSTPSDQTDTSWATAFPNLVNKPVTGVLQMDVYDGPNGKGYVASVFVGYADKLYSRSQNYGPETWRTEGWHIVETGRLPV